MRREASAVVAGQSLEGNAFGFQGEAATTALLFASAAEEKSMVATCIDASACIFAHTHMDTYISTRVDNVCVVASHALMPLRVFAHRRIQMHTLARL